MGKSALGTAAAMTALESRFILLAMVVVSVVAAANRDIVTSVIVAGSVFLCGEHYYGVSAVACVVNSFFAVATADHTAWVSVIAGGLMLHLVDSTAIDPKRV